MIFYYIGTDYRNASVGLREQVYPFREDLKDLVSEKTCGQAALLWTCNRIEVYGLAGDNAEVFTVLRVLRSSFPWIFRDANYTFSSPETCRHALRLAVGMESQLRGEEQIFEQLSAWIHKRDFPGSLHAVWKRVLSEARQVRETAGITRRYVNVADVIYRHIDSQVRHRKLRTVGVLGTGCMAQLVAAERPVNMRLLFFARKRHARARQLARLAGGKPFLLDEFFAKLPELDAVISATSSPHRILNIDDLMSLPKKNGQPVLLYDLAVPRDMDPRIKDLAGYVLRDLDGLQPVFTIHNMNNMTQMKFAEKVIGRSLNKILTGVNDARRYHRIPAEFAGLAAGS